MGPAADPRLGSVAVDHRQPEHRDRRRRHRTVAARRPDAGDPRLGHRRQRHQYRGRLRPRNVGLERDRSNRRQRDGHGRLLLEMLDHARARRSRPDAGPLLRRSLRASAGPSTTGRASSTSASRATASTPTSSAPSSTPLTMGCSSSVPPGTAETPPRSIPGGYPGRPRCRGHGPERRPLQLGDARLVGLVRRSRLRRGARCGRGPCLRLWLLVRAARRVGHRRAPHVARPQPDREPDHRCAARDRPSSRGDRRRADRRLGGSPLPGARAGESTASSCRRRRPFPARCSSRPASSARARASGSTSPAGRSSSSSRAPPRVNCSMSFRAAGSLYVDLPAERNVRSLAATLAAGSYPITDPVHDDERESVRAERDRQLQELGWHDRSAPPRASPRQHRPTSPHHPLEPAGRSRWPAIGTCPALTRPRVIAHWLASNRLRTPSLR